jgi:hypothetical protein
MSSFLKSEIISYIKRYTRDFGKPPTVKVLCDNISGVNRANFYKIFPDGIGEACTAAGVEVPEKRIKSTDKAIKTRRSSKVTMPQLVLSLEDTGSINTIAYMENLTPKEVIHEIIENDRILRREYGLRIHNISRLAIFLNNSEFRGVSRKRIIDSLNEFIKLGMDQLPSQNFDLLISLWGDMLRNNWTFNNVLKLYEEKQKIYTRGYAQCMNLVQSRIVEEIRKSYDFDSISLESAIELGSKVVISLGLSKLANQM